MAKAIFILMALIGLLITASPAVIIMVLDFPLPIYGTALAALCGLFIFFDGLTNVYKIRTQERLKAS